jgi:hypothetical protein
MPLRRNLSATDRQQAIRTERFRAEIEKLSEMARRLRAKLENCYVEIKRYTVSVAAEEKKNPEFRKRTRRPQKVRRSFCIRGGTDEDPATRIAGGKGMVAGGACRPSGRRSRHNQCHRNRQVRPESSARFQDRTCLWQKRGRSFSVSGERTTSNDESRRLAVPVHHDELRVIPPTPFGRPLVPVAVVPCAAMSIRRKWTPRFLE